MALALSCSIFKGGTFSTPPSQVKPILLTAAGSSCRTHGTSHRIVRHVLTAEAISLPGSCHRGHCCSDAGWTAAPWFGGRWLGTVCSVADFAGDDGLDRYLAIMDKAFG